MADEKILDTENVSNFIHDIIDSDLAEGRVKEIHTRFPPEPNGYLHIGSAKAIWINSGTAQKYHGLFNLRFDDTNPVREDDEYVKSIEEDLRWLGAEPTGGIYYGSDYFDQCYEFALKLIREGKAYVDDLSADEMREYRGTLTEPGKESPYRNRSVEENLDLFERMKNGEFPDGSHTLRAKIDMASPNMNLRDPAIYRIVRAHHHRQGDKWCIYPLYDYAHPIQDALEGITHSLCSIEFENHRPLYDWVVDNIGFEHKPHQYEFARLNVTHTVMSKRYLRELVETKKVDGWDDPRMPTICGLRRRGYTPTAINEFVKKAGVAKAYSIVDIGLLEHCIRDELNTTAQRRVAVLHPIKVVITNYPEDKEETFELPNIPKNEEAGVRAVPFTRELYIDADDFAEVPPPKFFRMKPDGEVRLMGAYIVKCNEVIKDEQGNIVELHCTADLETGNGNPADGRKIKGTIHWVSAKYAIDATVRLYDYLFTLENVNDVPEGTNYLDYLNPNSLTELHNCKLEPALAEANRATNSSLSAPATSAKTARMKASLTRLSDLKTAGQRKLKNKSLQKLFSITNRRRPFGLRLLLFLILLQDILVCTFVGMLVVIFLDPLQPIATLCKQPLHGIIGRSGFSAELCHPKLSHLLLGVTQQPLSQALSAPVLVHCKIHDFDIVPLSLPVVEKQPCDNLLAVQQSIVDGTFIFQQILPVFLLPKVGRKAKAVKCHDFFQGFLAQSANLFHPFPPLVLHLLLLCQNLRIDTAAGFEQVVRLGFNLKTNLSPADHHRFLLLCRAVKDRPVAFLHPDGRAAAADVSGDRIDFGNRNHLQRFFSKHLGCLF